MYLCNSLLGAKWQAHNRDGICAVSYTHLGAKAYLTLGNEKSIDIRITKDDGSWISVDVKSVRKGNAIPVGNAVGKMCIRDRFNIRS